MMKYEWDLTRLQGTRGVGGLGGGVTTRPVGGGMAEGPEFPGDHIPGPLMGEICDQMIDMVLDDLLERAAEIRQETMVLIAQGLSFRQALAESTNLTMAYLVGFLLNRMVTRMDGNRMVISLRMMRALNYEAVVTPDENTTWETPEETSGTLRGRE